ncbi:hypothetical protein DC366_08630 [Pelagivirga sediminicola]|uniref:Peptidase S24/S26A/S26B/S26C domain-containing protein n=1 Tax=Pelagivirga sediminicola TaxID=2170575 RepID=A0A2T7G798_9RHOB|nr:hypothetical protein [Pelagivirga sediminicola]PVA10300.1 hypothetical protein DC366_08630 [Pelagivirga sediminicola]
MALFSLEKLREIADEGIARHGLRGYARKLGLDVSTMRSLRDGRDMQISKVTEIIDALGLTLVLRGGDAGAPVAARQFGPHAPAGQGDHPAPIFIAPHEKAPHPAQAEVAFQADWLAAQGWSMPHLRCITAPARCGPHNLWPGALCLLECSRDWPDTHETWAYLDGADVQVSYLDRPGPGALLISGNDPAQPTRLVTGPALDTITPLGRVVWAGVLLRK